MYGEGGGKGAILFVAVLCLLLGCLRWARLVMRSRVYSNCNLAELCGHNLSCTLLQMILTSPESVRMFSSIRLLKGLERKSKLFFLRVYSLRTEFASLQSYWICRAVRMPKDRVPYHEWLNRQDPTFYWKTGFPTKKAEFCQFLPIMTRKEIFRLHGWVNIAMQRGEANIVSQSKLRIVVRENVTMKIVRIGGVLLPFSRVRQTQSLAWNLPGKQC